MTTSRYAVLALLLVACAHIQPRTTYPTALQGIWRAVEVSEDGRALDAAAVNELTLTIWRDRYLVSLPDGTAAMKLSAEGEHEGRLSLSTASGPARGRVFRGRYALLDDTLTLSYASTGATLTGDLSTLDEGVRVQKWDRIPTRRQPLEDESLRNSIGMEMRLVLPGTFVMGSPQHEPRRVDEVQRRVTISRPFYIGAHEVTLDQFRRFTAERRTDPGRGGVTTRVDGFNRFDPFSTSERAGFPQSGSHPVVYVSWDEANDFCEWLSAREGRTYRLPTEAEWEYAARAGSQTAFWWGENPDAASRGANIADRSYAKRFPHRDFKTTAEDGFVYTAPVGSFAPNPFGLYDVSGNVFEWVQDYYGLFDLTPVRDPVGPASGQFRVARGGGWASRPSEARSAFRFREDPSLRFSGLGFRVLLQID